MATNSLPAWDDTEEIKEALPAWDDTHPIDEATVEVAKPSHDLIPYLKDAGSKFVDMAGEAISHPIDTVSSMVGHAVDNLTPHNSLSTPDNIDYSKAQKLKPEDFTQNGTNDLPSPGSGIIATAGSGLAMMKDAFTKSREAGNTFEDAMKDARNVFALLVAGEGVGKVAGKVVKAVATPNLTSKVAGKVGSFASGVDEDALIRQARRPAQSAAAELDGFEHKVGQKVIEETSELGKQLGAAVDDAGEQFKNVHGQQVMNTSSITSDIEKFLTKHEPSENLGISGLTSEQVGELQHIKGLMSGKVTGEDLYKLRNYLDNVENLAKKYDIEGTSPYVTKLKSIRGQADAIIDGIDTHLDSSNKAYSQYLNDKGMLRGTTNESQAEGMVSNLYGANKTAKREAFDRLVTPETREVAKDIAANKEFEKIGPAGSEKGLRNLIKMGLFTTTNGMIVPLMSPKTWKSAMRIIGKTENALPNVFSAIPEKYSKILGDALKKSESQFLITHKLLYDRNDEYRQAVESAGE